MELNITNRTNRIRRNSQAVRVQEQTTKAKMPPSARTTPGSDRLTLSQQALDFLKVQNQRMEALRQAVQQSREKTEGTSEEEAQLKHLEQEMKVMNTCQKIAARVMAGDKVPPEDLQYLMNNDPDGYKLALAMRTHKPDPKEYKSALEETDREARTEAQAGQASESAAGTPEPASASGSAEV